MESSNYKHKNISIVFIGSGPVAAKSLELLSKTFSIEAVITKPQPMHHKSPFPVLALVKQMNFPVFTVSNKHEVSSLVKTKRFQSKIAVLIDFGILVKLDVINYFPFGIINSHFSLLPQWRGADPITFTLLSGQTKTGVSLMLIDVDLDTGKLITQKSIKISESEDSFSLTNKLISLSDSLLTEYLPKYISGNHKPRNQPHTDRATYSRKLNKTDGIINWEKTALQIDREIRAYLNWPKSTAVIGGKKVIITKACVVDATGKPGKIDIRDKSLIVFTRERALRILAIKPAGKNEMSASAFLAGYRAKI